ncbi:hypothetical protein AAVH_29560, partial [Aphelenchoides avenae]
MAFDATLLSVFLCLERHELEKCQLVCSVWRHVIDGNNHQLPLRTLEYFKLHVEATTSRRRNGEEKACREVVSYSARSDGLVVSGTVDSKLMCLSQWEAFRRLRNTYVKQLQFSDRILLYCPLNVHRAVFGGNSCLAVGTLEL